MINAKTAGMLAIAFVAGSFVASPELRAYAANTVFSTDIVDGQVMTVDLANNAVTSAKIKDGEVKTADIGGGAVNSAKIADNSITAADIGPSAVGESEIGPNAVGASELQGVTKLMFIDCPKTVNNSIGPGNVVSIPCTAPGTDVDDLAIASHNGSACWAVTEVESQAGYVTIFLLNTCSGTHSPGAITISLIVFDT